MTAADREIGADGLGDLCRATLERNWREGQRDGIGHTIFVSERVSGVRSLFYNVRSRSDFMTSTIQPPLLPWAWRIAVGDPAQVPEIVRHHEFVERERSLDGDGLLWIMQPDESGLDASPKFDSTFGWSADGLPGSSSGSTTSGAGCFARSFAGALSRSRCRAARSRGRRCPRWRCPTCPRRSPGA